MTAVSASVAPLLGVDASDVLDRPVSKLLRGLWRSEPMRLLIGEVQTGFASTTTLRVANGKLVDCAVAVRHLRTPFHRWVFIMLDADGLTSAGGALLRHVDDADIVIGVGNGNGGIDDVSANVARLLGYDAATFSSRTVAGVIHADDYPNFLAAASNAVTLGHTTSLRLRLRHADGRWVPLRLFLALMGAEGTARLTFVLVPDLPSDDDGSDPADGLRLEEVEQRLRRIALEIAALGLAEGLTPGMASEVAQALGQLSPKRQEIVARLQSGERVPTISEQMFLSQSTIRNHLSATFRHFGVTSQEELVRLLRGGPRP
ncbi:MAG: Response regulator containing a CheY-like receiver domain and an DNA-binding domain [Actinomycetia bacterium]|nr:Response regulator containing a CheY-like receiver domain and an DNA-binding domain [Actinomycetes bacterium]